MQYKKYIYIVFFFVSFYFVKIFDDALRNATQSAAARFVYLKNNREPRHRLEVKC